MNEVFIPRRLESWVAEYDAKVAAIPAAIAAFEEAGRALTASASVGGFYGEQNINTGHVYEHQMLRSLRVSAWRGFASRLNLDTLMSASDKKRFDQMMADPLPFDLHSIRAVFGDHIQNPRLAILRGMAEVFADLDPAFKSHEKMKIGVKGLPKRVIIHGVGSFHGGKDRVRDILNALAAYQGKPLVTYAELNALMHNGDALREDREVPDPSQNRREREADPKTIRVVGRGIWLKQFSNGNGHLFFGPEALRDVNMALAEFYGDVLPDCPDWATTERPAPQTGTTAVSKDLQYYPTPRKVIDGILSHLTSIKGLRVLEPSCGDGRIMDALRERGADLVGCEVDPVRAMMAEAKGHKVMLANFLATEPTQTFDMVVMNPPFAGKHYAKHVRHALRFLRKSEDRWRRPTLIAILPATARYDHGLLDDLNPQWRDLPVGAFSESGTNVCTTVATIYKDNCA